MICDALFLACFFFFISLLWVASSVFDRCDFNPQPIGTNCVSRSELRFFVRLFVLVPLSRIVWRKLYDFYIGTIRCSFFRMSVDWDFAEPGSEIKAIFNERIYLFYLHICQSPPNTLDYRGLWLIRSAVKPPITYAPFYTINYATGPTTGRIELLLMSWVMWLIRTLDLLAEWLGNILGQQALNSKFQIAIFRIEERRILVGNKMVKRKICITLYGVFVRSCLDSINRP